jgi:ABC-type phosphate/phosphonate transport system periplasmic component
MQLTVAPDYLPPHFGAWYLISGLIGQETGRPVRLHMPGDTRELEDTLARQQEGIAYVNSFSASRLIREQGWIPLLKPAAGSDETVIICRADAPYRSLRDVQPHCSIVCADEDVHLIGMRLLEGFGLNEDNTLFYREESEEAVLSSVFHGKACTGFLMAEMFDGLSEFGKQQFRVIMRSAIEDICHLLLLHPGSRDSADSVKQAFLNLGHTPAGQAVLNEFRRPEGFAEAQHEEVETMLDLLTTLED